LLAKKFRQPPQTHLISASLIPLVTVKVAVPALSCNGFAAYRIIPHWAWGSTMDAKKPRKSI
ncbi:MAG: hypothetical protein LUE91_05375, partial [Oscillospiraceae bacterium]|nr:hypothetical protein [Oscillospiraceae bacterium]